MIGKTLGHYRVGEQLGRGGMGEAMAWIECTPEFVPVKRRWLWVAWSVAAGFDCGSSYSAMVAMASNAIV